VVVLLKAPEFQSAQDALQIGKKAWPGSDPVEIVQTLENGSSHILRHGKFWFAVHQGNLPYDVAGQEATELLQRPWDEHTAWLSIDLPMQSTAQLKKIDSLGLAYRLLLVYAFLCWSPNCLALNVPAEGITVPNLGDLAGSITWARKNGQNLDFLSTSPG
jgi:hypothetical protein